MQQLLVGHRAVDQFPETSHISVDASAIGDWNLYTLCDVSRQILLVACWNC